MNDRFRIIRLPSMGATKTEFMPVAIYDVKKYQSYSITDLQDMNYFVALINRLISDDKNEEEN